MNVCLISNLLESIGRRTLTRLNISVFFAVLGHKVDIGLRGSHDDCEVVHISVQLKAVLCTCRQPCWLQLGFANIMARLGWLNSPMQNGNDEDGSERVKVMNA